MYKSMKKYVIKSQFIEIFFKLATNGQSDKAFLFDIKILSPRSCLPLPCLYMYKIIKNICINFVSWGLTAPDSWLYTFIKS